MIEIKMFTSPTCGPCKMMKPIIEGITKENGYSFEKFCIVEQPELAASEEIQFVPTTKIYKDGVVCDTIVGMKSKQMVLDIINRILGEVE